MAKTTPITDIQKELMIQTYAETGSFAQAANVAGCSPSTAARFLKNRAPDRSVGAASDRHGLGPVCRGRRGRSCCASLDRIAKVQLGSRSYRIVTTRVT
jgi:hypothetical protein